MSIAPDIGGSSASTSFIVLAEMKTGVRSSAQAL
jgi:hypothetical protein